jgi:hypothetical protein
MSGYFQGVDHAVTATVSISDIKRMLDFEKIARKLEIPRLVQISQDVTKAKRDQSGITGADYLGLRAIECDEPICLCFHGVILALLMQIPRCTV